MAAGHVDIQEYTSFLKCYEDCKARAVGTLCTGFVVKPDVKPTPLCFLMGTARTTPVSYL